MVLLLHTYDSFTTNVLGIHVLPMLLYTKFTFLQLRVPLDILKMANHIAKWNEI